MDKDTKGNMHHFVDKQTIQQVYETILWFGSISRAKLSKVVIPPLTLIKKSIFVFLKFILLLLGMDEQPSHSILKNHHVQRIKQVSILYCQKVIKFKMLVIAWISAISNSEVLSTQACSSTQSPMYLSSGKNKKACTAVQSGEN